MSRTRSTEGAPGGEASGQLSRLTLDAPRKDARLEVLRHRTGEFPRVAPCVDAQRHRYTYFDGETGVAQSFAMGEHEQPSEAVFVPRKPDDQSAEASGYLLSLVYDDRAHRSHFVVFDAEHLDDGPLARASLSTHVPPGFHGTFRAR